MGGKQLVKALLQRVLRVEVSSDGEAPESICYGSLIFVGIAKTDTEVIAEKLADKILKLRLFDGNGSKFDKFLLQVDGDILLISQFTLLANTTRGRRPSFNDAARPTEAQVVFDHMFNYLCRNTHLKVKRGKFGSRMIVKAENLGPFSVNVEVT